MRPVANAVDALILQHPDETAQVKNTGGLLAACLQRSVLRVGETFDVPRSTAGMVLLYPELPCDPALPEAARWPFEPPKTLVVLDATWRKSRRMLYLNPWLAALPRLSLQALPPSRYGIRRAQTQDQRSTLEAVAVALAQLEGNLERYEALWQTMDDFVALQQRLMREGRARRAG